MSFIERMSKINIRTITIIDNENGCEYVQFNNINDNVDKIEIKRGEVEISCENLCNELHYGYPHKETIFTLKVTCYPDELGNLYYIQKKKNIKDYSNEELINELKNRKVILEKKIYEVNA